MISPQGRRLTFLLGVIIAVGPMSVDMYLPAYALIQRDFPGKPIVQLTVASYFIGLAIGQIFQGPFSDRVGRRWSLATGLTLYTLASLGCAGAHGVVSFCLFRALAGFGGAASIVVPRSMVMDLAEGKEAGNLFSRIMMVMGVAPVVAPALGNVLLRIDVLGIAPWRWVFITMALYGMTCLTLLFGFLPETLPPSRRLSFQPRLVLKLDAMILRERGFLTYALIGSLVIATLYAYLSGSAALFMGICKYSSSEYAGILVGLGVASIGFYRLSAYLVRRWGVHSVVTFAAVVLTTGSAGLVFLAWLPSPLRLPVILGLLVVQFGISCAQPNVQPGALARHRDHAGSATALMSTLQYCSGAAAGWLVALLPTGTFRPMAIIMLACGLGAVVVAGLRPRGIATGKVGETV